MSGTLTAPADQEYNGGFSNAEKVDIRRFCGYPTYGIGQAGFNGWRFFQAYGLLEYRLNNFAPEEYQRVRYLLSQLTPLESAIWGASGNLSTDAAAVWTHNKNEVRDRIALYNHQRIELCNVVGVPPGPNLKVAGQFTVRV